MRLPQHTVDCCIYCGSFDLLTDEHVVPLGLGGDLIFPKSSCVACNEMTSRFELKVLRGHMTVARAVAGLPTRRKKGRPTSVSTKIIRSDGSTAQVVIPLANAGALMLLPVLAPAAMIYGFDPVPNVQISGIDAINVGQDLSLFAVKHGADGIAGEVRLEHFTFCQVLCKIAYSYQVAMHGAFERNESPALAILRGEELNASNWVGTSMLPLNQQLTKSLHLIESRARPSPHRETVQVVTIQLFSNAGQSTFEVVVHAKNWRVWAKYADA